MRAAVVFRAAALVAFSTFMCACTTRPISVPPEYPLVSPQQTTAYLKWAFTTAQADERPKHVYNCLSDGFIERNKITLSDVEIFWNRVEDTLEQYVGKLETVEIAAERVVSPRRREVDFRNGDRRATVAFVLQTSYEITPTRRGRDSVSGSLPDMTRSLRYEGDDAVLRLPGVDPKIDPEEVYRIDVENAWKIDDILRHNLDDLERTLEKTGAGP